MKCPSWTYVHIPSKIASSNLCPTFLTRKVFIAIEENPIKHEIMTRKPDTNEIGCEVSNWIVAVQILLILLQINIDVSIVAKDSC